MPGYEYNLSWDADELENARRLIDAGRAYDTGEPRQLHLLPVPYELPMTPSANVIKGVLSAAHRAENFGLNQNDAGDRAILDFADRMLDFETDAVSTTASVTETLAESIDNTIQVTSAQAKKVGRKVGRLILAFGTGIKA